MFNLAGVLKVKQVFKVYVQPCWYFKVSQTGLVFNQLIPTHHLSDHG